MSDYGAIEGGTPEMCKAAEDETIEYERIHRKRRMRGYGAVEDGTSAAWWAGEHALIPQKLCHTNGLETKT